MVLTHNGTLQNGKLHNGTFPNGMLHNIKLKTVQCYKTEQLQNGTWTKTVHVTNGTLQNSALPNGTETLWYVT
jgi:hypothetical protein